MLMLFCLKKEISLLSFQRVYIEFLDEKSLPCDTHESMNAAKTTNLLEALPQIQTELKVNPQNLLYFTEKFPPASPLLVKQQYHDAWMLMLNVATNTCNVSDCERCHAYT